MIFDRENSTNVYEKVEEYLLQDMFSTIPHNEGPRQLFQIYQIFHIFSTPRG